MNKKIAIVAILSIIIQLLLTYARMPYAVMLALVFFIGAIPYALYHLFKNGKPGITTGNVLGTLFVFPLFVISMMAYYSDRLYPETEIDPESIEFYDADGNEIPADSLLKRLQTDSTAVHRIKTPDSLE
jgi:hypothetical protein